MERVSVRASLAV